MNDTHAHSTHPSRAVRDIAELLTGAPLPDSNATHIRSYERDYAIVLHERGRAGAEATMANILAFEMWRRRKQDRVKP